MPIFAIIVTVLAGAVGLEWVVRNLLALRVWRAMFHLTSDYPLTCQDWPTLSVVVPARNEQANIGTCLTSLLSQDYGALELIAVNDRSTDETGRIMRAIAAKDARLRVVDVETLPEGWCGKNHAMQRGIGQAHGEWILMHDADCRQVCPCTLRLAVQYALDTQADMLSLMPEHRYESFWERYLLPILSGVLMIWFRPSRVSDPRTKVAFANGMFMLIRRTTYQAVGTHQAVRASLIEDIDLARLVKGRGLNLRVAPTTALFIVRMYSTLAQIVRGWERIFIGAFRSVLGLTKVLLVLIGRGMTPVVTAALGWSMVAAEADPRPWWHACALLGSVSLLAQLVMTVRFSIHLKSRWAYGLTYPVACLMVAALLVKAMGKLCLRGKIVWRDTTYQISHREKHG
ncbi:MAG: glycosyltransferase [Planctomycetota bacterium]|nr:glycosyltransferase [Planctomycetota bacterium]